MANTNFNYYGNVKQAGKQFLAYIDVEKFKSIAGKTDSQNTEWVHLGLMERNEVSEKGMTHFLTDFTPGNDKMLQKLELRKADVLAIAGDAKTANLVIFPKSEKAREQDFQKADFHVAENTYAKETDLGNKVKDLYKADNAIGAEALMAQNKNLVSEAFVKILESNNVETSKAIEISKEDKKLNFVGNSFSLENEINNNVGSMFLNYNTEHNFHYGSLSLHKEKMLKLMGDKQFIYVNISPDRSTEAENKFKAYVSESKTDKDAAYTLKIYKNQLEAIPLKTGKDDKQTPFITASVTYTKELGDSKNDLTVTHFEKSTEKKTPIGIGWSAAQRYWDVENAKKASQSKEANVAETGFTAENSDEAVKAKAPSSKKKSIKSQQIKGSKSQEPAKLQNKTKEGKIEMEETPY